METKDDDTASIRTVLPAYSPAPRSYRAAEQHTVPRPPSPAPTYRTVDSRSLPWRARGRSIGGSLQQAEAQSPDKQRSRFRQSWWLPRHKERSSSITELNDRDSLHDLVVQGRVAALRRLLASEKVDIDSKIKDGCTALLIAIQEERSSASTVECLLEYGADPTVPDSRGWMPLHVASDLGRSTVVNVLLQRCDLDVDEMAPNFRTPIQLAAAEGHRETVSVLLGHGASYARPLKGVPNSTTPLHLAARGGHSETVSLLLDTPGADLNVDDHTGRRALDWAIEGDHDKVIRLFLEKDPRLEPRDSAGGTFLHRAARQGRTSVLSSLLDRGDWDINGQDKEGHTPLYLAALSGSEETVKLLLNKGADVAISNKKGSTVLHLAVGQARIKIALVLLKYIQYIDINHANSDGQTMMHVVCGRNAPVFVQRLLQAKPDLSLKDSKGNTPFMVAHNMGRIKVMDMLLKEDDDIYRTHAPSPLMLDTIMQEVVVPILRGTKIDVNTSFGGSTGLHYAAKNGYVELLDWLLTRGADPKARDGAGQTPAELAAEHGHFGVLEHLGAEHLADTKKVQTALALAISNGEKGTLQCIILNSPTESRRKVESIAVSEAAIYNRNDLLQFLLDSGADINGIREHGWTPLHMAALHGHDDAVRLLLSHGANPNLKSDSGLTALLQAANGGYTHLIQLLLRNGARISDVDYNSETALHLAARRGHHGAVATLLDEGADINARNYIGQTALDLALHFHHPLVIKLLPDSAGNPNGKES